MWSKSMCLLFGCIAAVPTSAQGQQQVGEPDQLRVQMTAILFDSLAQNSASVSPDGRQVLLSIIDVGVNRIRAEGMDSLTVTRALDATRRFAGDLIARVRQERGSVRLGENTGSYANGICPLWPFC